MTIAEEKNALRAALREKGREFTPVSIELVPGSTVITGANMGGKSVAVKTLALNAFLAMSGMPVFAREAKLPMLSDIHLLAEDMEDSKNAGVLFLDGSKARVRMFDGVKDYDLSAEDTGLPAAMEEFILTIRDKYSYLYQ